MDLQPLAVIGTVLAILGLLIEHFHYQAKMQERVAVLETQIKCLEGMEGDVREIKTKMSLFWSALEEQIPHLLMKGNPIDPASDLYSLLAKFCEKKISLHELKILDSALQIEVRNPEHTPGEKLAIVFTDAIVRSKLPVVKKDGQSPCFD